MAGMLIGRDAGEVAEKGRWMQSFLGALSGVQPNAAPEALRRKGWIVGTPEQAASQLAAWSALGIERVMFQWFNLDDLGGLDLLAELNKP
jgi:alkanesulfonate monooxygenase SsuD/methylene tetrahydromethanopterin reductase-like flavin-dependent oxidoreductase (luciferase family)